MVRRGDKVWGGEWPAPLVRHRYKDPVHPFWYMHLKAGALSSPAGLTDRNTRNGKDLMDEKQVMAVAGKIPGFFAEYPFLVLLRNPDSVILNHHHKAIRSLVCAAPDLRKGRTVAERIIHQRIKTRSMRGSVKIS